MADRNVLRRLDEERRRLAREGRVLDVLPSVTRLRTAAGSRHMVVYSALTADTADAVVGREIRHHETLGAAFEWKAYAHDAPPDLLDGLRRRGFDVGPQEAVLVCGLTAAPAWVADDAPADPSLRVERVVTPEVV